MKIPIHSFKQRIVYGDNSKPPRWSLNSIAGWLGSGVLDKNKKEIYEGDKVKVYFSHDDFIIDYVVFSDGAFCVADFLLTDIESLDIEIVGHVED